VHDIRGWQFYVSKPDDLEKSRTAASRRFGEDVRLSCGAGIAYQESRWAAYPDGGDDWQYVNVGAKGHWNQSADRRVQANLAAD